VRPQTALVSKSQPFGKRPISNILRPDTTGASGLGGLMGTDDALNKVMNSLTLNEILELYEAKCADNCVDYMGIQAKYFVDKFNKYSVDGKFYLCEQSMSVNCANYLTRIL
jgi:hypothetical protein